MERKEGASRFGIDPATVGVRHRHWWLVETIHEEEEACGAQPGDLCVMTRDPGGGRFDSDAMRHESFRNMAIDDFDSTYCYYYFKPLVAEEASP